ncbi:MAG: hydroxymethylglutaryl-CoA lyase [Terracidiphilus sp.]
MVGDRVKIVECPRDAWQGLPAPIPPEVKAGYLRKLIEAGFTSIDAVSFVSPAAVPQMADSERVLEILQPPEKVEIIAIVVNEKGAERAIRTGAVQTLGFPYSISREFLRRNQHQTPQEALAAVRKIVALAREADLNAVAYISMAFGNPYNESWSRRGLEEAYGRLIEAGVRQISLADTVGLAPPEWIADIVGVVISAHPGAEIGVHLHARRDQAPERIRAALEAGCRRFDSAIGGLGGCPFAQDALVGNIPTEILVAELAACGAVPPALAPLDELLRMSAGIAAGVQASAQ